MNSLETLLDNVKQPYSGTSDEESEELYASKGKKWRRIALVMESDTCDKDKGDTDRSAWKEASDPGKKKKCQGRKATDKGKAGHKGQSLSRSLQGVKLEGIVFL